MKINCSQAVGQLADFLDKTLPQEVREAVAAHMGRCPACVAFTETYKKTTELCRKVALMKEPPAGLTQRVLDFVGKHGTGR